MPIAIDKSDKPSKSSMNPKVNRGVALIGSNPTIAHRIPKEHAINPLIIDFPVNPATKVKANKTTKVNSVGPNFRANFEKGLLQRIVKYQQL